MDDERLEVLTVWEPILRTDDEVSAWRARSLLPDPRVEHFWTDDRSVGHLFAPAIGLKGEPAWDVYLVYPPGASWDSGVPAPVYFQHQLGGRLPADRRLDGETLRTEIARVLAEAAER